MHARTHVAVLSILCLLAVAPLALGDDAPQRGAAPPEPPSITYPPSRSSQTWIEKPDGSRVAVGEGVEWQGVKVFLSLLWDLVAVDVKSGKTLYAVNVGAFWNGFGFRQVARDDGTKTWAVELRPGPRTRHGADKRQYHDLRTGARLEVPGVETTPAGTPCTPRAAWHGKRSRIATPFQAVVSTAANWKALRARMFAGGEGDRFGPVDFEKEIVLVVSSGNGWNCNGITPAAAYESDARLLLRTQRLGFQTMNGAEKVRAYGVFVLPRRAKKAYVVEENRQGLIGGPPLWTRIYRLPRLEPAEIELRDVPQATQARHEGWAR